MKLSLAVALSAIEPFSKFFAPIPLELHVNEWNHSFFTLLSQFLDQVTWLKQEGEREGISFKMSLTHKNVIFFFLSTLK